MPSRAQNLSHFVANEVFYSAAGQCEVFSWIEVLGRLRKGSANGCSHGQSEIGINIDLRTADATRDLNVRFGDPSRFISQLAANPG